MSDVYRLYKKKKKIKLREYKLVFDYYEIPAFDSAHVSVNKNKHKLYDIHSESCTGIATVQR